MLIRINIYPLFISGWSSNNKYALIGAIRGIAQTVSYEVRLATILIFYVIITLNTNMTGLITINRYYPKLIIILPLAGI
jgi:NADH:ubiquinone oxidoreductase subunit H